MNAGLGAKRLGILHELLPQATRIAALTVGTASAADVQEAAAVLKLPIEILAARTGLEIDPAFPAMAQTRTEALAVGPTYATRRAQVGTLAAYQHVRALHARRDGTRLAGLVR